MLSMEQENTIETLNREVHRQQQQIQALEIQLKFLKEKIDSISKEELLAPEIEGEAPPPHYWFKIITWIRDFNADNRVQDMGFTVDFKKPLHNRVIHFKQQKGKLAKS